MLTRILRAVRGAGAHGRIARGMGTVSLFLLIGKFAGAFKEIATASRFGVSETVDAYVLAFGLIMLLPSVWTGVMAMVFVPIARHLDENECRHFVAELTGLTILAGGMICLVLSFVVPPLVPLIWSDYSADGQAQLARFFVWISPTVLIVLLSGQYAAQLMSMERHVNSLAEGAPSLVLGLFILFYVSADPTLPFIAGTMAGYLVQFAVLVFVLRGLGRLGGVSFRFRASGWTLFRKALGIMLISSFIMSLTTTVDLMLASQLGSGGVSTFGYAQRVLLLGMTLGATAAGRAMLPVLSGSTEKGEDARRVAGQWSLLLLFAGIVAIVLGWFLTPMLIRLLFERGAFSAEDSRAVSDVVRFGLVQLPFYLSGVVLAQYAASQRRFTLLLTSSIIALSVKLALGWILSRQFGVPGIMLSSGIMYLCTCLFFWGWMIRDGRSNNLQQH